MSKLAVPLLVLIELGLKSGNSQPPVNPLSDLHPETRFRFLGIALAEPVPVSMARI